jgi:N-acetylneuraminic acid mutarotase
MEYYDGYLYLFGGQDSTRRNKNSMYKYDITKNKWEIVKTKGKPPGERCYHEMSLINKYNFVIFGGIKGSLPLIETYYDDIFLYNITEEIWVEPVIGGVMPHPRLFFSLSCNYNYEKMEVIILGGQIKDNDNVKHVKIFTLMQNGKSN